MSSFIDSIAEAIVSIALSKTDEGMVSRFRWRFLVPILGVNKVEVLGEFGVDLGPDFVVALDVVFDVDLSPVLESVLGVTFGVEF